MRVNNKPMTLKDFFSKVIKRVKVLRTFQRKICWTDLQCKQFVASILKGRATMPITLVDLAEVVEYCEDKQLKEDSKFFRNLLSQGYRYISIDGQNRTQAIRDFFENKFSITGDFEDKDGERHSITNKFYKDLPERLQDAFNDQAILLTLIEALEDRHEMHYAFIDHNSGTALNAQELRNALLTPMAKCIRDLSENQTISKIWEASLNLKEEDIKASSDAALTAKFYMVLSRERDSVKTTISSRRLDDAAIDEFYKIGVENNNPANICSGYKQAEKQRVEKILKKVSNILVSAKVGKSTLSDRALWAVVLTTAWINDSQNYYFQPGKLVDFYKIVTETDRHLVDQAEIQHGKDIDHWYKSGRVGSKPKNSKYYKYKASNVKSPTARKDRFNQLTSELLKNPDFVNIVTSVSTAKVSNA